MEGKYLNVNVFVALIAICLFFPGMISHFGLALEQILTMFLFASSVMCIFLSKMKLDRSIYFGTLIFYFYFQLSITISLLRSTDIFVINDFIEIIKPLYLLSFFMLPFCIKINLDGLVKISNYLILFCLLLIVFGIIEAWTNFGKNVAFLLYKDNREVLANKAVGPFIITYVFASFLVLPFYYFLIKFIASNRLINLNFLYMLLALLCIFSTQSKTVFIGVAFSLIVFVFCYLCYDGGINKKRMFLFFNIIVISLISSIGVFISLFEEKFSYIYNGLSIVINGLINGGVFTAINSTPSTQLRFEQLMFAIESQDFIPLIGVGVGKGVFMPESLYAMYLYRFGLIGIMLHFSMLIIMLIVSKKNAMFFSKKKDVHLYSFFLAIHFYVLSLPLSYFSSAVNDQTRTGFVFYILFSMCLYVNKYIVNGNEAKKHLN